jgi:hypothetical protein
MRIVPTSKLAAAIGVTTARVYQLRRDAIIGSLVDLNGRRVRNKWALWESVGSYAQYKAASRYAGRPSVGERDEVAEQSVFEFLALRPMPLPRQSR